MAKKKTRPVRAIYNGPVDLDGPSYFDPKITVSDCIIGRCRVGLPGELAARYAGVSYPTYSQWRKDGWAALRRKIDQPSVELTEREERLARFAQDVDAALGSWVNDANHILEQQSLIRTRVSTRVKTEVLRANGQIVLDELGNPRTVEVENVTTTTQEPVEVGPLTWRLGKVVPQVYGPLPRYDQEGEDGQGETIDIAARVDQLMEKIAANLVIKPDEPT